MKKLTKGLLAGALSLMLVLSVSCSGENSENQNNQQQETSGQSDTILLGGTGPLSGAAAMYGTSVKQGLELAVAEINADGGILGKQVELEFLDDKSDAVEATNGFNRLIEKDIVAFLGAVTSKPSDAVAQLASDIGIPMITPSGTALSITTHGENIFRMPFVDPFQGEVLAKFAKEELGATKVALVRNNSSDYSEGVAGGFVKAAEELGLEIVADESYSETDVDFKSQLIKIKNTQPDVLLIPDYYQIVSLIAPQAREVGLDCTLIGSDGWDGVVDSIQEDALPTIEDSYFTNTFALDDPDEKVQEFIKNYTQTYNSTPQSFGAMAYDCMYLLKDAIERAGTTEQEALVESIRTTEYTGISGSLKFDEERNPIKSVFMTTISDGNYKLYKKM